MIWMELWIHLIRLWLPKFRYVKINYFHNWPFSLNENRSEQEYYSCIEYHYFHSCKYGKPDLMKDWKIKIQIVFDQTSNSEENTISYFSLIIYVTRSHTDTMCINKSCEFSQYVPQREKCWMFVPLFILQLAGISF